MMNRVFKLSAVLIACLSLFFVLFSRFTGVAMTSRPQGVHNGTNTWSISQRSWNSNRDKVKLGLEPIAVSTSTRLPALSVLRASTHIPSPSSRRPVVHLTGRPPMQTDKYVEFGRRNKPGRLGNQMHGIAAMIYVATLAGRRPVLGSNHFPLMNHAYDIFNLSAIERINQSLCPCYNFKEINHGVYDRRVEDLGQPGHKSYTARTVVVWGNYESWLYTRSIEATLRRLFKFNAEVQSFAETFLESNLPPGWNLGFTRVAVHARRGDQSKRVIASKGKPGFTVPDTAYYTRAMQHFLSHYERVQFIVASDDLPWARKNVIAPSRVKSDRVNVTYTAKTHSPGQDMAILASCDHVIMSIGTYGWWAGWLNGGTVIYYKYWPSREAVLGTGKRPEEFYLPGWIAM